MKRRGFIGGLLGLVAAPVAVDAAAKVEERFPTMLRDVAPDRVPLYTTTELPAGVTYYTSCSTVFVDQPVLGRKR